jgi:hypothetical protein
MNRLSLLLLCLVLAASTGLAQLKTENFSYDAGALTTVAAASWTTNTGAGNKVITVSDGNLSYPGYSASGIGRKISLVSSTTSAEDAYTQFTAISAPGSVVYAAYLINVTDVVGIAENTNASGDYFVALLPSANGSDYVSRVAIRKGSSANTFQLGIKAGKASTQTPEWYVSDLNVGETYLIVNSYELVSGATNDIANLWVNPTIGAVPPASNASQVSTMDIADVARFGLRQAYNSGAGTTPNVVIDGINISEFWGETLLPVQLSAFSAIRASNDVQLSWSTISEVNNFGFYVERKLDGTSSFVEVPNSFVAGHATTLEPQAYTFTDNTVTPGVWYYRLRQVDLDGSIGYSEPVKVEFTTSVGTETPATYGLSQNYPNPFNPSTDIQFSLAKAGTVSLKVYDMLGREVATLVNGERAAGVQHVMFNAINLPSGAYFYALKAGSFTSMKSMMLVK